MAKRGTCGNCEREDQTIIAKGLCWVCYNAQRNLDGEERDQALAEIKERIQDGKLKKWGRNKPLRQDPPPETEPEKEPSADNGAKTLRIVFDGPDLEIYHALEEEAAAQRREISAQALIILEGQFIDRMVD